MTGREISPEGSMARWTSCEEIFSLSSTFFVQILQAHIKTQWLYKNKEKWEKVNYLL